MSFLTSLRTKHAIQRHDSSLFIVDFLLLGHAILIDALFLRIPYFIEQPLVSGTLNSALDEDDGFFDPTLGE